MSLRKKGLGKGLSALVQESIDNPFVEICPDSGVVTLENQGIRMVSVESILPNRYQPRKSFDPAYLEELASSIREYGIIQPLIVSDLGDNLSFELVAGERRLKAAKIVGMKQIPIVVKDFEEKDRLAVSLIENIQRADLNAVEIAEAYQEIMQRLALTQEDLAKIVGKNRATVANTLRILRLPEKIRYMIIRDEISEGHGRALLSMSPNYSQMELIAKEIVQQALSVRETEDIVRKFLTSSEEQSQKKPQKNSISGRLAALEEKLIQILGVKTKISGTEKKGLIKLYYHNTEELEVLMRNIYETKSDRY